VLRRGAWRVHSAFRSRSSSRRFGAEHKKTAHPFPVVPAICQIPIPWNGDGHSEAGREPAARGRYGSPAGSENAGRMRTRWGMRSASTIPSILSLLYSRVCPTREMADAESNDLSRTLIAESWTERAADIRMKRRSLPTTTTVCAVNALHRKADANAERYSTDRSRRGRPARRLDGHGLLLLPVSDVQQQSDLANSSTSTCSKTDQSRTRRSFGRSQARLHDRF